MQVMIKFPNAEQDGLVEKEPVILNPHTIAFIEKITPIMKNPNASLQQKQIMDELYTQNCWIVQITNGQALWVENETALQIEQWLATR